MQWVIKKKHKKTSEIVYTIKQRNGMEPVRGFTLLEALAVSPAKLHKFSIMQWKTKKHKKAHQIENHQEKSETLSLFGIKGTARISKNLLVAKVQTTHLHTERFRSAKIQNFE